LKSCRVLQDHYDNERDVDHVSQHNTGPARPRSRSRPQCARPRPRPIFWSHTGHVLRQAVSDHTTGVSFSHCVTYSNLQLLCKCQRRSLLNVPFVFGFRLLKTDVAQQFQVVQK